MKILQNRHFAVCLSARGFAGFAVTASLVGARRSVATDALRLHELGMIKSSTDKIIARGTDWRFLRRLSAKWDSELGCGLHAERRVPQFRCVVKHSIQPTGPGATLPMP